MPKFLEDKLKAEYPNNPHAVYGTMNAIGAMHGNKETAKGRAMERKHARDEAAGHADMGPDPDADGDVHPHKWMGAHEGRMSKRMEAEQASEDGHTFGKHAQMVKEAHGHLSKALPGWDGMSKRMQGHAIQEHVRTRREMMRQGTHRRMRRGR